MQTTIAAPAMLSMVILALVCEAAAIHVPSGLALAAPGSKPTLPRPVRYPFETRLRGGSETISPSTAPEPPVVDLHSSAVSTPLLILLPVAYFLVGVAVYGTVLENRGKDAWTFTDCLYFISASMSTGECESNISMCIHEHCGSHATLLQGSSVC